MSLEATLSREVAERQIAMFQMFVGQGCYTTRAALERASGISESTLRSWASGVAMPLHAVLLLRRFLPREAINMLTEPGGCCFSQMERSSTDWDGIAAEAAGLVGEVCEARRDGNIDHVEDARLRNRARALAAVVNEVVTEH